jgi:hypothetical protein
LFLGFAALFLLSSFSHRLMQQCWKADPADRPEWDEAVDVCKATALTLKERKSYVLHDVEEETRI